MVKAVALLSDGLDSLLAVKLSQSLGVEVIGLHFYMPFSRKSKAEVEEYFLEKVQGKLGIKVEVVCLGQEYLDLLISPQHGYGRNLNPCIDCKIFMLSKARTYMKDSRASFVITGEVVGQRPMSQQKASLQLIEQKSGLPGLLLRPLSAKLLPVTIAEEKGWVEREKLLAICGRGRRQQIELADKLAIKDFSWPAGGCLLTEPEFCRRVKDLLDQDSLTEDNVELLKLGRHFRVSDCFKLVVGRDEAENNKLLDLMSNGDLCFEHKDLPGPTGIGKGACSNEVKTICARIIARYTSNGNIDIVLKNTLGQEEILSVESIDNNTLEKIRI